MPDQRSIALQMIQQLRVLDPAISAEIGTPERKIIDTVAQALAEAQIDINALSGALDIDAKVGSDLDKFLALFGFGRQKGVPATGYVTLSRVTASNYDIPIPRGTQVAAPSVTVSGLTQRVGFATTEAAVMSAGTLEITIPIECLQVGVFGNVAASAISTFGASPILGITTIENEVATQGGINGESDDEFKVRFKNTVFRNLSGTEDQYLALAVATQYSTKANVVGPISRYREYVQVPDVADDTNDPDSGITGNGSASEWTTALSTIPYSKHVYGTIPYFAVSNDTLNPIFYRQDVDFRLNTSNAARDRGDTYRGRIGGSGANVATDTTTTYQPNLTFTNVYTGTDNTVEAVRAQDIVLFEHSYMSSASRNDYDRQVLNCVDVFVNGSNDTLADTVVARPSGSANRFTATSTSVFYVENFRRVDEPKHRPVIGNYFTPLYSEPATALPDEIKTSDGTFVNGTHYWLVTDVTSDLGGSVRARNGIEWATNIPSHSATANFGGPKIAATADSAIAVSKYSYNRNIIDLQISLEGNKQVTTDVLAHAATKRFFKFDLTVMYDPGASVSDVNARIQTAVSDFLNSQFFGTTIQLSDILQIVHNVSGVDNVRWSHDLSAARNRVTESDINGKPLLNVQIDRKVYGDGSTAEVQTIYLTGSPTGGTYTLSWNGNTTAGLAYNASSSTVQTALTAGPVSAPVTVAGSGTAIDPFVVTFTASGTRNLLTATPSLTGSTSVYNTDFFLKDDELPFLPTSTQSGDTVAGLILRTRAQNTWGLL